jgi:hypothetical protein
MEYANDGTIPERMSGWVRLYLWGCNHDKWMCAGIDGIIITTNVIGGVVNSSCPEAVDCIVANANIISIIV